MVLGWGWGVTEWGWVGGFGLELECDGVGLGGWFGVGV